MREGSGARLGAHTRLGSAKARLMPVRIADVELWSPSPIGRMLA
jgi:hypothetical protein